MNVKKILLFVLVIAVLGGAYAWFFVYNKPHTNIDNVEPEYRLDLSQIISKYIGNFEEANTTFNGKVIEITASVDRVVEGDSISSIVFKADQDYEVFCEVYPRYNNEAKQLNASDKVSVKGFVSGAEQPDEMLEIGGVIRLKKCSFEAVE